MSSVWMLTINNPDIEQITKLIDLPVVDKVWQYEISPTTGTLHIHAYIEFAKPWTAKSARKLMRGHWEVVRDKEAARAYCQKLWSRIEIPFVPHSDRDPPATDTKMLP